MYTILSLFTAGVGTSSDSGKYAMCVTYNYTHALAHTENAGMQQHWASVHVCVTFHELES